MLYYIIDLARNAVVKMVHSREAVVEFFIEQQVATWEMANPSMYEQKKPTEKDSVFRSLNMNGNDTARAGICYKVFLNFPGDMVLRKYQVQDEYDRIVDPREWDDVYYRVLQDPLMFRERAATSRRKHYYYGLPGRKSHFHRHGLPALVYQAKKLSMDDVSEDFDDLDVDILIDHSSMRNKSFIKTSLWDALDKKFYRNASKSWKDQSHSRKQWGKHKTSCKRVKQPSFDEDQDDQYFESCLDAILEY